MTGLTAAGLASFVRRMIAAAIVTLAATCAPALAQPAMWVVKDADSTIYLLGTVHVLKPDTQWQTEKLEAAIAKSDTLWMELPTTDPAVLGAELGPAILRYGSAKPGVKLSELLTPEELTTLKEASRATGMPATLLDAYRPWFAALNLSNAAIMRAGYDPMSGVDGKIEAKFKARNITPNGFETAEQQIKVFNVMSGEEELSYLRETLEEYQNASVEMNKLVTAWAAGDIKTLDELFIVEAKAEGGSFYEALFTNRNRNWAGRIETMLKGKGTIFIAVGAAHLIGEDSVLAMLKAKGIASERVQ